MPGYDGFDFSGAVNEAWYYLVADLFKLGQTDERSAA
jgi:hypothetical protein